MSSAKHKKPILVDMDNVLYDFVTAFYRDSVHHFSLAGRLPPVQQMASYWIHHSIKPQSDKDLENMNHDADVLVSAPGFFKTLPVFPGAVEGFKYLCRMAEKQGRDVFICSAPHINSQTCWSDKAYSIERDFGKEHVDRLILTRDKTIIDGVVLIDDKPDPMGKHTASWNHVVFDHLYNQIESTKGKWRMMSWSQKEIDSLIGHIKNLP